MLKDEGLVVSCSTGPKAHWKMTEKSSQLTDNLSKFELGDEWKLQSSFNKFSMHR